MGSAMVKLYRDLINEQSETDQITFGNVVVEDRRPLWLLTFIDLISLLLAFFIMMFSMSRHVLPFHGKKACLL